MQYKFNKIGTIFTNFDKQDNMPIQSVESTEDSTNGKVVIYKKYIDGLKDLNLFSHIYLLYYFHKSSSYKLQLTPFLDSIEHGIFATRAPSRPNHIGISIVRLISVNDNILYVKDMDILDNTPLLDIKPYVKQFDIRENTSSGWINTSIDQLKKKKSDRRFIHEKNN